MDKVWNGLTYPLGRATIGGLVAYHPTAPKRITMITIAPMSAAVVVVIAFLAIIQTSPL